VSCRAHSTAKTFRVAVRDVSSSRQWSLQITSFHPAPIFLGSCFWTHVRQVSPYNWITYKFFIVSFLKKKKEKRPSYMKTHYTLLAQAVSCKIGRKRLQACSTLWSTNAIPSHTSQLHWFLLSLKFACTNFISRWDLKSLNAW
jgi:hypothetical protein